MSGSATPLAPPAPPGVAPIRPRGETWRTPAAVGAATVAATVVLGLGNPNTTHVPLCPLKFATGLDCPACGSLRAVHGLAHLDVADAFGHNALFTVAAPFLVLAWVAWLAARLDRPLLGGRTLPRAAKVALVVVAVAFGVVRNLPRFAYLGSA